MVARLLHTVACRLVLPVRDGLSVVRVRVTETHVNAAEWSSA